ncbi:hypothetical protein CK625_04355 [Vandammella animalimorsus]|uniref:Uncharacterized protein n=1 Tax=Vandammella animalimorsus TaxID=2029117 RepID=A0A2A2ALR5_9BURK|nr:hypothetical protein CK625_04355 [Vandammella animalimorsus]
MQCSWFAVKAMILCAAHALDKWGFAGGAHASRPGACPARRQRRTASHGEIPKTQWFWHCQGMASLA